MRITKFPDKCDPNKMWWNSLSFKCETCGAEWESEEFPDIECCIEE